jgi:putative ABC transport system substrate-binding protein
VRAQPSTPLIGYLNLGLPQEPAPPAFLQGLRETGFIIGQNARIEYRRTESLTDLPGLAAELVRLRPVVIHASPTAAALAAKAATSTIPIVFGTGDDPVKLGLVASLNRPGGNLTGVTNLAIELDGKRLAMLRELIPTAETIGVLVNPNNPSVERQTKDIEEAAGSLGRRAEFSRASNDREIDAAFVRIVQQHIGALFVAPDTYFATRRAQIVTLAAHYAIPTIYQARTFAEAGGLISYGTDNNAINRQLGFYVGRILKGDKPFDLPVAQPTKFDLVINLKAAKALGLTIPATILALADEVIE